VPGLYPGFQLYKTLSETQTEIILSSHDILQVQKFSRRVVFEGWELYLHFTVVEYPGLSRKRDNHWTCTSRDLDEVPSSGDVLGEERKGYGTDPDSAAYDLFFRFVTSSPDNFRPGYAAKLLSCLGPEDDISGDIRPVYAIRVGKEVIEGLGGTKGGNRAYYIVQFQQVKWPAPVRGPGGCSSYWTARLEKMSPY
jgi:hypothetical protein